MEKVIFYTDVHLTDRPPSSRKDNYYESIKNKLIQIDELSRVNKVSKVICGGDIVNKYNENYKIFNDLYEYFSNTYIKHDIVAGFNHDFAGGNYYSGINNSILGSLAKTGCINEVSQTYEFQVNGIKFYTSHQTICPNGFFGPHILYRDLKTDANIVLISHLHMAFGIQIVNGKTFVSPGSIGRNSCDNYNINRTPQVVLITCNDDPFKYHNFGHFSIEFIPLKVELDIFDQRYLINKEEDKQYSEPKSLEEIEQIPEIEQIIDSETLIREIGQKFGEPVVNEALNFKVKVENE
jgi:exonuclease SbcD